MKIADPVKYRIDQYENGEYLLKICRSNSDYWESWPRFFIEDYMLARGYDAEKLLEEVQEKYRTFKKDKNIKLRSDFLKWSGKQDDLSHVQDSLNFIKWCMDKKREKLAAFNAAVTVKETIEEGEI